MDYTQADIDSLAAKLAAVALTEGEQAVMDALVGAAEDEVAGFSVVVKFDFAPLRPAEFLRFSASGTGNVRKDSGEVHLDIVANGGGNDI